MKLKLEIEVNAPEFVDYYNKLDDSVTEEICSGTGITLPFATADVPTIMQREIEGWINYTTVLSIKEVS